MRIGAAIPVPGINTEILALYFKDLLQKNDQGNTVVGLFNLFSGGALENCAVFTLGIIPYISASIMMQLMTAVVPSLGKMAREEGGRQKITQYTRYATIAICLFQGYFTAKQFEYPKSGGFFQNIDAITSKYGPLVSNPGATFEFTTVLSLLAGTLLLMWLGEQITDKGIGNGISMVITINIVSRLPAALGQGWLMLFSGTGSGGEPVVPVIVFPMMLLFLFAVIAGTIAITQAQRKVTIQYAKQVRGNKVYGGPDLVPAAQGQLLRRHAHHLRAVDPHRAGLHAQDPPGGRVAVAEFVCRLAQQRHAALHLLHRDDLLLLLFLGLLHVQSDPDRGGRQAQRRVHPRRAPGRADGGFPRVHHDAPDPGRRDLPGRAGHPAHGGAGVWPTCRRLPASSSAAPACSS